MAYERNESVSKTRYPASLRQRNLGHPPDQHHHLGSAELVVHTDPQNEPVNLSGVSKKVTLRGT